MQEVAWQVLAPAAVHISAAELKRLVQTRPSRHKSASPCAGQSRSENRRTPASCERRWYGTTVAVPWTLARTPRSCRSAPTQRLCTSPCGWTRWFLNPAMSFDDGAKLFSTRFRTVTLRDTRFDNGRFIHNPTLCSRSFFTQIRIRDLARHVLAAAPTPLPSLHSHDSPLRGAHYSQYQYRHHSCPAPAPRLYRRGRNRIPASPPPGLRVIFTWRDADDTGGGARP